MSQPWPAGDIVGTKQRDSVILRGVPLVVSPKELWVDRAYCQHLLAVLLEHAGLDWFLLTDAERTIFISQVRQAVIADFTRAVTFSLN